MFEGLAGFSISAGFSITESIRRKMNLKFVSRLITRYHSTSLQFVPKHDTVSEKDVNMLREFIANSQRMLILTGAGISTESGIPDYRSADVGLYERRNYKPVKHQEFCSSFRTQQRYWARNYVGWPTFSQRQPNVTHNCVKNLETVHRKISSVVTQNVDNLHYKAGSEDVIELHGSAYRVVCLGCNKNYDRYYIQEKLEAANPNFKEDTEMVRPDGDVEISAERLSEFVPPSCEECGGILKPDIVNEKLAEGDSLLILGSSLTVFSAYRIVLKVDSYQGHFELFLIISIF
ncbi:NAD-dependent protein deacylase Sirt4-like isoform X2 [Coccinella septempunctata]|uniref:NAD-dependent protein deacylase Sirt4-like isoform X2 n=1 Tax=Coccinella septempunctata TaxID=41139 RepID=UPI001D06FC02|nr:NAD-dependent protein deacylase Sirt4-like isoform X2 [Coccinella septempunctata]